MSTLKTTNLQHASAASPAIVLASDGTATAQLSSLNGGALSGARNRIINGDMRIDQRNAGASVTGNDSVFPVDRLKIEASQSSKLTVQQNAGSITPPSGFSNYCGVTSSSAYSVAASDYFAVVQYIEGYNVSDLAFGSASASTITLSFWVRSSLTGTFGGALRNSGASRSRAFAYTISAANTWEYKTVTIAGDTTGTWLTTNGIGLYVAFGLGVGSTYSGTAGAWAGANYLSATGATSVVGTNGATFYITGVQLEAGSVATPFERRSYGQELQLCLRYFETSYPTGTPIGAVGHRAFPSINYSKGANTTGECGTFYPFTVEKRVNPSIAFWDGDGNLSKCSRLDPGYSWNDNQTAINNGAYRNCWMLLSASGSSGTAAYANWTAYAEL